MESLLITCLVFSLIVVTILFLIIFEQRRKINKTQIYLRTLKDINEKLERSFERKAWLIDQQNKARR